MKKYNNDMADNDLNNECDPNNPQDECHNRLSPDKREQEKKFTGGGLNNFLNDSLDRIVKDQCNTQGGIYNKDTDACHIEGVADLPSFSKLIGRDKYKDLILREIGSNSIPSMLLVGPFGSGKTSFAKAIPIEYAIKHNLNPKDFSDYNVIEVSGRNGINFIKDKIEHFVKAKGLAGNYKFVLLDEADDLTPDAQRQLKTTFNEIQSRNIPITIILMSNYPGRILPDITQSGRFRVLNFDAIPSDEMTLIAKKINPKIQITNQLIEFSNGNIRSLQDNLLRIEEGLQPYDYRQEDIEQLQKKIDKEETNLEIEHKKMMNQIRKDAMQIAAEYTRNSIIQDIIRLSKSDEEDAARREDVLIEALKYKGMTDSQISAEIVRVKKATDEKPKEKPSESQEFLNYWSERGVSPQRLLGQEPQSQQIQGPGFSGIKAKAYNELVKIYERSYELKNEGKEDEADNLENKSYLLIAYYEDKYHTDMGDVQRQAIKDAMNKFS